MTNKSSSVSNGEDVFVRVTRPERIEGERPRKATDPNEKHLCTDHLLGDLKGRTISGAFITTASQGTQFLLNLAFIMVLARLLTPKDFGLYAMVTTVTGFLWMFQDAGLSTATVQRQQITHAQVSNLYWVNIGVGGVTTLLVAALSPGRGWAPATLVDESTPATSISITLRCPAGRRSSSSLPVCAKADPGPHRQRRPSWVAALKCVQPPP